MKARECPYCHKRISISRCSYYFWRGTDYSIHCNHCHKEVWLEREPIPFMYCVCAGFIVTVLPMNFFLYYMKFGFLKSMLYTLPIFTIAEIVIMILTLRKMKFAKTKLDRSEKAPGRKS